MERGRLSGHAELRHVRTTGWALGLAIVERVNESREACCGEATRRREKQARQVGKHARVLTIQTKAKEHETEFGVRNVQHTSVITWKGYQRSVADGLPYGRTYLNEARQQDPRSEWVGKGGDAGGEWAERVTQGIRNDRWGRGWCDG